MIFEDDSVVKIKNLLNFNTDLHTFSDNIAELYKFLDNHIISSIDSEEREKIDCREGCGTCCQVSVSVLIPIAVDIAINLLNIYNDEQIKDLIERMREQKIKLDGIEEDERIMMRIPCVFLDENQSCSIHKFRPFICRSVTSANAQDCKDAIAMAAFDEEVPVLMNLKQKDGYENAFRIVGEHIKEENLDDRSTELTIGVYSALKVFSPELTARELIQRTSEKIY